MCVLYVGHRIFYLSLFRKLFVEMFEHASVGSRQVYLQDMVIIGAFLFFRVEELQTFLDGINCIWIIASLCSDMSLGLNQPWLP